MKKATLFVFLAAFGLSVFASLPVNAPTLSPKLKAAEIMIPIGKSGKKISLLDLSTISAKDLQNLTGKKMNFFDRLAFKASQKKLKKSIDADGTITSKKINKFFSKRFGPTEGFHALGFILGFFLGLIGVLIAYLMNDDDDKQNRVKWSWIGFGAAVLITLIFVLLIINSID